MYFKKFLLVCCLGYSTLAFAQNQSMEVQCQNGLLEAERQRNTQIYTQCGFDDIDRAMMQWKGWAERNNAYQAMYELCARFPDTRDGVNLCQKAAIGGNGPALVYQADKLYDQKKYREAFQSYSQALKSPMLTNEEKGQIAEKIGVLYLDPQSSYYNPAKGLPLMEKAVGQRGALANNVLGVYFMYGLEKQPVDMKKAFEYLWRSVLLGCPNAEENLGLFYLVHQKKITLDQARQLMSGKIFTCQSSVVMSSPKEYTNFVAQDCDCVKVMQKEQLASQYSYRLISVSPTGVVMRDQEGRHFTVTKDGVLPNGAKVSEIHKSAIVLMQGQKRQILNLAPDESCVGYCKAKQENQQKSANLLPDIKPYHFTFTPSECSDLLYYAERLVDTNLPFTGKKECGFSGEMDEATKLLLSQ